MSGDIIPIPIKKNFENEKITSIFFQLTRKIPIDYLDSLLDDCIKSNNVKILKDLILLTFHVRNYHSGKGEKSLFIHIYLYLYDNGYPETMTSLLPTIIDYGTWKDYNILAQNFLEKKNKKMVYIILDLIKNQILLDKLEHELSIEQKRKPKLSLVAKYAPKQNHKFHNLSKMLALKIFGNDKSRLKKYRILISTLNKSLGTTEIYMCKKEFSKIDPNKVSFVSKQIYERSFLNLKSNADLYSESIEDKRHPDDDDRNQCRLNFKNTENKENKIKYNLTFKNIINYLINPNLTSKQKDVLNKEWNETFKFHKENNGNLFLLPIIDISSSMKGAISEIANIIGIIISELTFEKYNNKIFSFTDDVSCVEFNEDDLLFTKITKLNNNLKWETRINIEKTLDNILQIAIDKKLNENEIPDIVIITDMDLNDALVNHDLYNEIYLNFYNKFFQEGLKNINKPWKVPFVKYWNIKGDFNVNINHNIKNIKIYNGYSQMLFEHIIFNKELYNTEVTSQNTSYEVFKNSIDKPIYNKVRNILSQSNEGILSEYNN
tara:strand:- start:606 stop:2249 length:1644 start_codon:yes stop_codon:yes gene_type:complete